MGRTKSTDRKTKQTAWKKTKHRNRASQKAKRQTARVSTGPVRAGNSRMIFKNSRLCAQFLRDNFDIPVLKDIKPEDISDVSEKYRAYLGIHFEADTVKKSGFTEKQRRNYF